MQCCHQIGVVHHTGHFVYVIAVHSKSACSPNFEGFPWGVQVVFISFRFRIDEHLQVCSLQFGSWINSQYGVEYRLPRNSTVGLTDFQQTVGWQVSALQVAQLAQLVLASFSSQPLPQRWSTQSPGWCPDLPETRW